MQLRRIAPDEAKQLLESDHGCVYLDVRTTQEFDAGHVPGARNVPVFQHDAYGRMVQNPEFVEVVEANFGRNARIITGCQMGGRSLKAAEILSKAGFRDVVDMRGGFGGELDPLGRLTFPGWAPRGFPVSKDSRPEDRYDTLRTAARNGKPAARG
jgi:rhodanese-related sulfurtransferase